MACASSYPCKGSSLLVPAQLHMQCPGRVSVYQIGSADPAALGNTLQDTAVKVRALGQTISGVPGVSPKDDSVFDGSFLRVLRASFARRVLQHGKTGNWGCIQHGSTFIAWQAKLAPLGRENRINSKTHNTGAACKCCAYQCSLLPCISNPLRHLRCCFSTQKCSAGVSSLASKVALQCRDNALVQSAGPTEATGARAITRSSCMHRPRPPLKRP